MNLVELSVASMLVQRTKMNVHSDGLCPVLPNFPGLSELSSFPLFWSLSESVTFCVPVITDSYVTKEMEQPYLVCFQQLPCERP